MRHIIKNRPSGIRHFSNKIIGHEIENPKNTYPFSKGPFGQHATAQYIEVSKKKDMRRAWGEYRPEFNETGRKLITRKNGIYIEAMKSEQKGLFRFTIANIELNAKRKNLDYVCFIAASDRMEMIARKMGYKVIAKANDKIMYGKNLKEKITHDQKTFEAVAEILSRKFK